MPPKRPARMRAALATVPEASEQDVVHEARPPPPPPPSHPPPSPPIPSLTSVQRPPHRMEPRDANERASRLSLIADLQQSEHLIPPAYLTAQSQVRSYFDWDSSSDEGENWLQRKARKRKQKQQKNTQNEASSFQQITVQATLSPELSSPTSTHDSPSPATVRSLSGTQLHSPAPGVSSGRSSNNSAGSGEQQYRSISSASITNAGSRSASESTGSLRVRTAKSLKSLKAVFTSPPVSTSPSIRSEASSTETARPLSPSPSPVIHDEIPPVPPLPVEYGKKARVRQYLSYSSLRKDSVEDGHEPQTPRRPSRITRTSPMTPSSLTKSASSPVLTSDDRQRQQHNIRPLDQHVRAFMPPNSPMSLSENAFAFIKSMQDTPKKDKKGKKPVCRSPDIGLGISAEATFSAKPLDITSGAQPEQVQDEATFEDTNSIFSSISPDRIDRAFGPDYNPHLSTFGGETMQYLNGMKPVQEEVTLEPPHGLIPHAESSRDAVLRARRRSTEPGKVIVTPASQQQIEAARQSRERRLASLPNHPLFHPQSLPAAPLTAKEKTAIVNELTQMLAQAKAVMTPDRHVATIEQGPDHQISAAVDNSLDTPRSPKDDIVVVKTFDKLETEINSAILEWQECAPPTSPQLAESRQNEAQTLRQMYGLAPLRSSRLDAVKHPKHSFSWCAEKLMCRMIHNPLPVLPTLPAMELNSRADSTTFEDHFFQNINHNEYEPPKKCASMSCDVYCCHYGKLFANSSPRNRDITEYSRAMQNAASANKLKSCRPNGVEEWESFQRCTYCSKEYCPRCITLCAHSMCQQPFCIYCSTETRPYCQDHE